MSNIIRGFGIRDVEYNVTIYKNSVDDKGKLKRKAVWVCPYYRKWTSMIERCYNPRALIKYPSYKSCYLAEEWKYLSNFIKWVDSQPNRDWQDCQLDKDFLVIGNRCYGPDTCLFTSRQVNNFATDSAKTRGDYLIGVSWNKRCERFVAYCCDPFKLNARHIGYFDCEIEAHKAWQAKKHEYACALADLQDDPRVAQALRERYSPDKDWSKL
jgi:hypothetical protein